jgi:hypothetical protein
MDAHEPDDSAARFRDEQAVDLARTESLQASSDGVRFGGIAELPEQLRELGGVVGTASRISTVTGRV